MQECSVVRMDRTPNQCENQAHDIHQSGYYQSSPRDVPELTMDAKKLQIEKNDRCLRAPQCGLDQYDDDDGYL